MSVIPKFLTRMPLIGCSFEMDCNGAGGVLVTIPDGYYWVLGTQASTKSNTSTTSVAVASGQDRFAPGDIVDIWDVSLGVDIVSGATVVGTSAGVVEIDTPVSTDLGDLLYHAEDLVGVLDARLKSADLSESSDDAYVTLRSVGTIEMGSNSGSLSYDIAWGSDGTELRDRLRFAGDLAVTSGSPANALRPTEGTFYPSVATVDERLPRTTRRDEHESDYGDVQALTNPQVKRSLVTVRCIGDWRTPGTELHDLEDFLTLAGFGYRVRYYPDRDEPQPYDADDAPWGYEDWLLRGPLTIDPNRLVPTRNDAWQETLDLAKWVDG